MRVPLRVNAWSSFVLSLILLAANVGAPFRTSGLGRTFLHGHCHDLTANMPVRVRAVALDDVAHGFRALVGISGDGPEAMSPEASSHPCPAALVQPSCALPSRQVRPLAERPVGPLRC